MLTNRQIIRWTLFQTGLENSCQQPDAVGMTPFPVDLAAAGAPEKLIVI